MSDQGMQTEKETERSFARPSPTAASRAHKRQRHDASRRTHILQEAIEAEVIPRLLAANRRAAVAAGTPPPARPAGGLGGAHVEELTRLVLADQVTAAEHLVARLRAQGATLEDIYLDLLAPVARQLGTLWEEDLCDFGQVAIGLGQLHRWTQALGDEHRGQSAVVAPGQHILLVPGPGERHTFGLTMVTEFFRNAGWTAWSGDPGGLEALLALVRADWFAVVGFSVAVGADPESLAGVIRQVRAASRNTGVGIMVGGPFFLGHPELVAKVGADATAVDGRQAVAEAMRLLAVCEDMTIDRARA